MSQGQIKHEDRYRLAFTLAGVSPGDVVVDGDTVGFAMADAAINEQVMLRVRGHQYTEAVAPDEVILAGACAYYNPVMDVVTARPTDWPIGRFDPPIEGETQDGDNRTIAKAVADTGVRLSLINPYRGTTETVIEIDYNQTGAATSYGAVGAYTLRTFDSPVEVYSVVIVGDSLPAGTSFALGQTTGAGDLYAATAGNLITFNHWDTNDTPAAPEQALPVTVADLVLTLSVGAAAAGILRLKIEHA